MENPCLTFVTPTLIAGDRSLTNVVAHEIAHSWFGNLVTNASWQDFWLNEGESDKQKPLVHPWAGTRAPDRQHLDCGRPSSCFGPTPSPPGFTVFLERKILGRLHGQQAYDFAAAQGFASLRADVERFGSDHNYTRLVPDLSGGGCREVRAKCLAEDNERHGHPCFFFRCRPG